MAFNASSPDALSASTLPSLPSYTLSIRPSLIPGIPDIILQLGAPVIAYWVVSLIFHVIDVYDFWPQYRLHTPEEILARNKVSRYECFRDVVLQQAIQTAFGLFISYFDPPEMEGKEQYDIAVWALRLRMLERYIPRLLGVVGVDAFALATKMSSYPVLSATIRGGVYASADFASWELQAGKLIYYVLVPFVQFLLAIIWVDTWQYYMHRYMHVNKFLYNALHSRHHRLYVPYAYGALYNHPLEGFFMDILGTGLGYLVTGMTIRQGAWLFTCSTIKTVDDHCGYAFPWDPLQHVTSNNAAYHDIHHQTWGIKTNFAQPFFTFWDRFCGTAWAGGDVSLRYERDRIAAQKKLAANKASKESSVTNSPAIDLPKAKEQAQASRKQVLDDPNVDGERIIAEEIREEQTVKQRSRRNTRRSGFGSFSDRVAGSLHSRSAAILHADAS